MRYFFHIVDRYGLCQDRIGFECATRRAAIKHAEHIAAELARAGEFLRGGAVFVTHGAASGADVGAEPGCCGHLGKPGSNGGRAVLP
ncbi:DUF6894 family protein [Bradyrhizobium sp. HKCCYLS1011]|uniref:DUF6894 family protein n=1 Tax=Bradyrhizobium sp. HKCCYLS1011 TaxID=3420733 RepID=UPI003EC0693B